MELSGFTLLRQPHVVFGPGTFRELPSLSSRYGRRVLLVTGSGALRRSGHLDELLMLMSAEGIECERMEVSHEPSPELVDRAVRRYRPEGIAVVLAVGGGSVIDAGKAVSAMLPCGEPVGQFIEGMAGYRPHDGSKIPFIAVPTTAGTGTEATNNAVISSVGREGYKRSLRHREFVPDIAVVDPSLMLGLPPGLTASSGMDAGTQLLEAYVSPGASPFTDSLAWSGLEHFARSFPSACADGTSSIAIRSDMAYAALVSGMALANAGLGVVHGFASSIGGYVDIPHGKLCGTLLACATRENIRVLRSAGDRARPFIEKYARAGRLFAADPSLDDADACDSLVDILESWVDRLAFPRLGRYGITDDDVDVLVDLTRSKNNPAVLAKDNLKRILMERL